jgi:hypothetical protein
VGLGVGGQHTVPAVEALRVARRCAYPADRALAERNRWTRPEPRHRRASTACRNSASTVRR